MTDSPYFYEIHIFCCINKRKPDHKRGSCEVGGASDLRSYLKSKMKKLKLDKKIRVNKSGCLDRCELGPVMVIYPEGVWYHYRNKEDIDAIVEQHFMLGQKAEHLLLSNDQ